jgi:hypothetical protein
VLATADFADSADKDCPFAKNQANIEHPTSNAQWKEIDSEVGLPGKSTIELWITQLHRNRRFNRRSAFAEAAARRMTPMTRM